MLCVVCLQAAVFVTRGASRAFKLVRVHGGGYLALPYLFWAVLLFVFQAPRHTPTF